MVPCQAKILPLLQFDQRIHDHEEVLVQHHQETTAENGL